MGIPGEIGKGIVRWYVIGTAFMLAMAVLSAPIFYVGGLVQAQFSLSDSTANWVMFGIYFVPLVVAAWWSGLGYGCPRFLRQENCMRWLRYLLMVLTVVTLGWLIYLFAMHPPRRQEWWLPIILLVTLVLNFVYVWLNAPNRKPGRLGRLFHLWLDAKEAELKRRANAGQPDQDH